jgi:hypothetical protein
MDTLRRLTSDPAVVAQQDQARTEREAKISPDERRLQQITRDPQLLAGDKALVAEMKQIIARMEKADPEDARRREQMTLVEWREQYRNPNLPKPWLEQYNTEFAGWEAPLYDLAHEHGLAAKQVRGLRDAAVDLGQVVGDRGRPASDADLVRIFDKYKVSPSARTALTRLWRQIEGGAS